MMYKFKLAICFLIYLAIVTVHGQIVADVSTLQQVHVVSLVYYTTVYK